MYLIAGYLGYDNYGDELLAEISEREIKNRDRFAEFKRLSSKNGFFEHFKLIKSSNEMICIGGLFQDQTGFFSVLYYFLIIMLAKFFGKRIRIVAQGIGPLRSPIARLLTLIAFKSAIWVSVRDKSSSLLLKEWKIDHYFGSDLAWLIEPNNLSKLSQESKSKIDEIFSGLNRKLVAVSLRSNKYQNDSGLIRKIINSLPEDYGKTPVMIFQMQEADLGVHRNFNEIDAEIRSQDSFYYIDANKFTPEELVYILNTYCFHLFGMRLHALILAKIAGIEVTPIAFDQKINEFRDQVELYSQEKLHERAKKHFSIISK